MDIVQNHFFYFLGNQNLYFTVISPVPWQIQEWVPERGRWSPIPALPHQVSLHKPLRIKLYIPIFSVWNVKNLTMNIAGLLSLLLCPAEAATLLQTVMSSSSSHSHSTRFYTAGRSIKDFLVEKLRNIVKHQSLWSAWRNIQHRCIDQVVKVQSLKIKAPANCGPKTIRCTLWFHSFQVSTAVYEI